ncbi:hypothetical protein [Ectothiorhodospira shaposhnikovii]|nr:hypothetical protein [Ectothiorhodospira shaposhnikovii]
MPLTDVAIRKLKPVEKTKKLFASHAFSPCGRRVKDGGKSLASFQ